MTSESTSAANDRQVGGAHYKGTPYQHWDFVVDARLPYLEAQVTRYLDRHRKKRGLEDVQKMEHYLLKLRESATEGKVMPPRTEEEYVTRYLAARQYTETERLLFIKVVYWSGTGSIDAALAETEKLAAEYSASAP